MVQWNCRNGKNNHRQRQAEVELQKAHTIFVCLAGC